MEKSGVAVVLVLAVMMVGFLYTPYSTNAAGGSAAPVSGPAVGFVPGPVSSHVAPDAQAPATTYPRTVMIETFTAEWCKYCPGESQALNLIEHKTNKTVLDIAELHVCASESNCGDNYVPPDGISDARSTYYSICGFPDVFFDGVHSTCGAVGGSMPALESIYEEQIHNASVIPGNVSIAQTATVTSAGVTAYANITSGVTGVYRAITYLVEYINKNDSSGHVIDSVVRAGLVDQNVSLVAGATTEINGTGALRPAWNVHNLSVITFVQQNTTKVIENANMVAVSTMAANVTGSPAVVSSESNLTITVRVTNSTTGAVLPGAEVNLTSSNGGSLNPASGVTASNGTFTSTFTAPKVTSVETIVISAQVAKEGYMAGSGATSVVVNPVIAPSVPIGLTLTPENQSVVTLSWSPPASGGGGVTYHVYRSTTRAGSYSAIGVSKVATYTDDAMVSGQTYWYTVSAENLGGFSANTTAISASAVDAVSHGLPTSIGWWLSIDSIVLRSSTNASISVHLPNGVFPYEFGPDAYTFVAPEAFGNLTVAGAPAQIVASFTPRYALLQGTVSPTTATVTLNGAAMAVADGSFLEELTAGTYSLVVSATGYQTNSSSITLTPGNTTTLNVTLQPVSPGKTSNGTLTTSNGGMSGMEMGALLAVVAAIAIAVVIGVMMMARKRKGVPQQQTGGEGPQSSPPSPPGP
jgi:hypothetical protein